MMSEDISAYDSSCPYCTGDKVQLDELGELFIGYGNAIGWYLETLRHYPDYTRIYHCPFCGRELREKTLTVGMIKIKACDTYNESEE